MKALIFSDTHRYNKPMFDAIDECPDAELIIHAGDMEDDVRELRGFYPKYRIEAVAGNNEFTPTLPYDRVFEFGGKKIFLTHGHKYNVKFGLMRLELRARELGADICIFGHTHIRHLSQSGGIYFLNPGAAMRGYAVLNITDGNVDIELI